MGGPNRNATRMKTKNISFHPIAMTGSQAPIVNIRIANPTLSLVFMDYFNIGILIP